MEKVATSSLRPTEAQHEVKRQRVEELDLQRYNSVSRFEKYTPIVLLVEQILMEIKHINLLREPEQMKTRPHCRDKQCYCFFHRDHGHMTKDCWQLKNEIENLIRNGFLSEFVNDPSEAVKVDVIDASRKCMGQVII